MTDRHNEVHLPCLFHFHTLLLFILPLPKQKPANSALLDDKSALPPDCLLFTLSQST
jgi:hypothetical protein